MEDNKYKIHIDNVYCDNAITTGTYNPQNIPINEYTSIWAIGLPKKQYWEVMSELKTELQTIVEKYDKHIKSPSISVDNNW